MMRVADYNRFKELLQEEEKARHAYHAPVATEDGLTVPPNKLPLLRGTQERFDELQDMTSFLFSERERLLQILSLERFDERYAPKDWKVQFTEEEGAVWWNSRTRSLVVRATHDEASEPYKKPWILYVVERKWGDKYRTIGRYPSAAAAIRIEPGHVS